MSVQKKKLTRRKTRSRRSHHALKKVDLTKCPKCKKATKPHIACPHCGHYKGRMVIDVDKRLAKKRTKREQKQAEKDQAKEDSKKQAADMKQAGLDTPKKDSEGRKVTV